MVLTDVLEPSTSDAPASWKPGLELGESDAMVHLAALPLKLRQAKGLAETPIGSHTTGTLRDSADRRTAKWAESLVLLDGVEPSTS